MIGIESMAKKKDPSEAAYGVLVTAAKTIGTTAGKIVAAVGVSAPSEPNRPKARTPKVKKKNKARSPQGQKKSVQKTAKRP